MSYKYAFLSKQAFYFLDSFKTKTYAFYIVINQIKQHLNLKLPTCPFFK